MSIRLLAAVVVLLAAVLPSTAGGARPAEPALDSYIVVLKSDAARSEGEAAAHRPLSRSSHTSSRARTEATSRPCTSTP